MKKTSKIGLTLAATAASLFASGCSSICGQFLDAPVKCTGLNACKGSSSCATPETSCKGQNSCKGSGWVYLTKDECIKRGGEVHY